MCKHKPWYRKELRCVGESTYSNNSTNEREQCKLLAKQIAFSMNVLLFKVILDKSPSQLSYNIHLNECLFFVNKDYSSLVLLKHICMQIKLGRGVQPLS